MNVIGSLFSLLLAITTIGLPTDCFAQSDTIYGEDSIDIRESRGGDEGLFEDDSIPINYSQALGVATSFYPKSAITPIETVSSRNTSKENSEDDPYKLRDTSVDFFEAINLANNFVKDTEIEELEDPEEFEEEDLEDPEEPKKFEKDVSEEDLEEEEGIDDDNGEGDDEDDEDEGEMEEIEEESKPENVTYTPQTPTAPFPVQTPQFMIKQTTTTRVNDSENEDSKSNSDRNRGRYDYTRAIVPMESRDGSRDPSVQILREQVARNQREILDLKNEIRRFQRARNSTGSSETSITQHRDMPDKEFAEELISQLRDRGLLNESKLASINLSDMITGICLSCGSQSLVYKVGDDGAYGVCNNCKNQLISRIRSGSAANISTVNPIADNQHSAVSYGNSYGNPNFDPNSVSPQTYPNNAQPYYYDENGNPIAYPQGDQGYVNYGNNYGAGSPVVPPGTPLGAVVGSLASDLGLGANTSGLLGNLVGQVLSSANSNNSDNKDEKNQTVTTTTVTASSGQLVMGPDGSLVTLGSLQGSNAPYGYVKLADGTLIPAASLEQGLTAAQSMSATMVLDANGKLVPLSSLQGTAAPYGYVQDVSGNLVPAVSLEQAKAAVQSVSATMVLDANGKLVPLSSLQGTAAPYGYVKDASGNLVPATSLEQAKAAAQSASATGITGKLNQVLAAVGGNVNSASIAGGVSALAKAASAASTAIKNKQAAKKAAASDSGTSTSVSSSKASNSNSTSASSDTSSATAKQKNKLKSIYEQLVAKVNQAEKTLKKLETKKDKAQATLDKRNDALGKAKNAISKKIAEKNQQTAQKNFDKASADYEKQLQDVDELKKQRDEAKAEYDAANADASPEGSTAQ